MLSTLVIKFNKRDKRQERILLITTKAVYNISNQSALMSLITSPVKRKIDIKKIYAVTISEMSGEFVFHVQDEYDYRYSSPERRDRILQMVCRAYYLCVSERPLKFYFTVMLPLANVSIMNQILAGYDRVEICHDHRR